VSDAPSERLADLLAELAEANSARANAEATVDQLLAELSRANSHARDIARTFEREAAARLEAEGAMAMLSQEHARLRAETDRLAEALRDAQRQLERRERPG
jgi:uncharacterized protein YigA (DUF484 family)